MNNYYQKFKHFICDIHTIFPSQLCKVKNFSLDKNANEHLQYISKFSINDR